MVEDIVHVGLSLGHEPVVAKDIAQFAEAVHIIGGLLEAPPVGAPVMRVLAHLEIAGPAATVERIGHRFRMTRETVFLSLQDFPDPALWGDVGDKSFRESGIGSHGNTRSDGDRRSPPLHAGKEEKGYAEQGK